MKHITKPLQNSIPFTNGRNREKYECYIPTWKNKKAKQIKVLHINDTAWRWFESVNIAFIVIDVTFFTH